MAVCSRSSMGIGSVGPGGVRRREAVAEVVEVVGIEPRVGELVEDGEEVVERADGGERPGVWRSVLATGCEALITIFEGPRPHSLAEPDQLPLSSHRLP